MKSNQRLWSIVEKIEGSIAQTYIVVKAGGIVIMEIPLNFTDMENLRKLGVIS